ncbi:MAG: glycosyltransferase [Flavobacteriales bacterium]
MKTILVCVTSDLATDNRILRHCELMHQMGFQVHLIGRTIKGSPPMPEAPYSYHRVQLPFEKGPLFYTCYQVWLFFYLLLKKGNMVWANDLDTALPSYLICKLKRMAYIVDSHELFTEVPELIHAPLKKSIWKFIEKHVAIKADVFITVNNSLATIFQNEYGIVPKVVRNVPKRLHLSPAYSKAKLGIPEHNLVLVLQGSGINKGRGLDETLDALSNVTDVSLLIIGGGNALEEAKQKTTKLGIESKVHFVSRVPYMELMQYTQMAAIGLAYDADPCLNFHFALPNKIFDYFQAGIAVISGPQPEISGLVTAHECGYLMKAITPNAIQWAIEFYQKNPEILAKHQLNSKKAGLIEHWDHEKKQLENILYTLM